MIVTVEGCYRRACPWRVWAESYQREENKRIRTGVKVNRTENRRRAADRPERPRRKWSDTTAEGPYPKGRESLRSAVVGTPVNATLLQIGVLASPLGRLLVALVAVAVVLFVGRFLLSLAWRVVTIAVVVVSILFGLSLLGIV